MLKFQYTRRFFFRCFLFTGEGLPRVFTIFFAGERRHCTQGTSVAWQKDRHLQILQLSTAIWRIWKRELIVTWGFDRRHSGLMISALDTGLSGPSSWPYRTHCVIFLTLGVPLSSHMYKWVQAKFSGNSTKSLRLNCDRLAFHTGGSTDSTRDNVLASAVWVSGQNVPWTSLRVASQRRFRRLSPSSVVHPQQALDFPLATWSRVLLLQVSINYVFQYWRKDSFSYLNL